jgi:hypothetical protein
MFEFWLYLKAICRHGAMTVAGVIVTIGGLAWEIATWVNPKIQGPEFRPWMLVAVGAALLFLSTFLTWRDEYRRRVATEQRLPSLDFQAAALLVEAQQQIEQLKKALTPRTLAPIERQRVRTALGEYDAGDQVILFERHFEAHDGEVYGHVLAEAFAGLSWHVGGGIGVVTDARYKSGLHVRGGFPADRQAVVRAFSEINLPVSDVNDEDHPAVSFVVGAS